MKLYKFIILLYLVFIVDITFSLLYVPTKPSSDYWKISVFMIDAIIVVYFGLKVVRDWYRLPFLLLTPLFIYWQLKDSMLGFIWHQDLLYLSNHWPDCYFGAGDGGWLLIIRAMGAFVCSGLLRYR